MWIRRKPVKALLFDVGGVLVTTQIKSFVQLGATVFGCSEEALENHLATLLSELERGELDTYSLWEELGESLAAAGQGTVQDPEKVELLWNQTLDGSLQPVQEMIDLCRSLQGTLPMAVLSNTIADHANCLRALGVYDYFNPCILSFEVGMRKPEARIYNLACELLNTPPENCLLIDDLDLNVKAARAAKLQAHLFTGRRKLEKHLRKLGIIAPS